MSTAKEMCDDIEAVLAVDMYALPDEALVIREMVTGDWSRVKTGRADLAFVSTDRMIGVEVKAASDRLDRLPQQVIDYGKMFDECWLTVTPKHFETAIEMIPRPWGLILIDEGVTIARTAMANPDVTVESALLRIWSKDVTKIGRQFLGAGRVRYLGKDAIIKALMDEMPAERLHEVRKAAIAAYHARRSLLNADRRGNLYGPTKFVSSLRNIDS